MQEELKYVTSEEIKQKITNHELWLRGEKELDHDFSNYHFGDWYTEEEDGTVSHEHRINHEIFMNYNLKQADFSKSYFNGVSFNKSNLTEASFKGCNIKNIKHYLDTIGPFYNSKLEGVDFREVEGLDMNLFSNEQKKVIILTDEDYEKYQEQKIILEENKKLKENIGEKEKVLKNTSEQQFNKLVQSFEKLEREYRREENIWLTVSSLAFIVLGFFVTIPVFDIFIYQYTYKLMFWGIIIILGLVAALFLGLTDLSKKEEKESMSRRFIFLVSFIKKYGFVLIYGIVVYFSLITFISTISSPAEPVFHMNTQYALVPLGILLSTFLYFSIYQFSRSKKLRIENQNKVALLHGMFGLKADTDQQMDKSFFYNNIADVVFSKVYQNKNDQDLPIDKVLDIVKIINSKK